METIEYPETKLTLARMEETILSSVMQVVISYSGESAMTVLTAVPVTILSMEARVPT